MSTAEREGHVVLGVAGGIAAYKAVEVLRLFQKAGLEVHACLTEAAARFVGPLTFAALSGHRVSHGRWGEDEDADMAHVDVTRGAALFVVAPATANVIAKLAHGIADDWLTTHFVASDAPALLAPAMNQRMWRHPSVQDNLRLLEARGVTVVSPGDGDLACGEVGPGRLADPEEIVARGLALLASGQSLRGRRVLVTSGPTLEDVDLVRFVGNRSSGKMGHALAAEAARRGADVVLVSGPVSLPPPARCRVVRVRSAEDMARAVRAELPRADVALFAAAVADFRPEPAADKIRREDRDRLVLELVRTPDVLAEAVASRPRALLVGFAAEVGDVEAAGRAKLARKGCDVLVVNRVDGPTPAFESDDNEAIVLEPGGGRTVLPRSSKSALAARLLDLLADQIRAPRRRAAFEEAGAATDGRPAGELR